MQVLRLHFPGDEPLDVRLEDLISISSSGFDHKVSVGVRNTRADNISYVPRKVEPVEREEDCDVDLH